MILLAKRGRRTTHTPPLFWNTFQWKNSQYTAFKDNVDSWVKQIRGEMAELVDMPAVVEENTENIQHNYELVSELRDEVEKLRQELNALKLIQIISLKNKKEEMKNYT